MRATKQEDEQLNRVWKLLRNRWPTNVCSVPEDVKDYYTVKDSLSLCEGLVTLGCHIVVPQSMTHETLERRHEGHQSIENVHRKHCGGPRYLLILKIEWKRAT